MMRNSILRAKNSEAKVFGSSCSTCGLIMASNWDAHVSLLMSLAA